MKRILIVCVNYNSYEHLMNYLDSIEKAKLNCFNCSIDVYIADNSTEKQDVDIDRYKYINIKIFKFSNLGYLGGASAIINNEVDDIYYYDFVIISNVDVLVDDYFFSQLLNQTIHKDIAWVAPRIFSENENRDRNPKIITRIPFKKLYIFKMICKFPVLFYIYNKIIYKRKKKNHVFSEQEIYAGHGSFIILTKAFFNKYDKLNYPIFLFGEELYFGELIKNAGLKVLYSPDIKINDIDHVSTSKMSSASYSKYNYIALKYIIDTFYE